MNYWVTVFSFSTWKQFQAMPTKICAYKSRLTGYFPAVKVGDKLVCYVAGRMIWTGVLTVSGERYSDHARLYEGSLFPIRIPVDVEAAVDVRMGVRMENLEGKLSFFPIGAPSKKWVPYVRTSPRLLPVEDGKIIAAAIKTAAN